MRSTTAGLCLLLALLIGLSTSQGPANSTLSHENRQPKSFQPGWQYTFTYNGQISSSLGPITEDESSNSRQKAVTRIGAQAQISFQGQQQAILRLRHIRMAQANRQMQDEEHMYPLDSFETKLVEEKKRKQMELPVHFEYQEGVIGRIHFHSQDPVWSRNMKRSVLNLIQVNLGPEEPDNQDLQQGGKSYTIPEVTIEGRCETTYTINKATNPQPYHNQPQPQQQQQQGKFNVTKTIDFKKCEGIADVGYGYQVEEPPLECVQCQKWEPWMETGQTVNDVGGEQQFEHNNHPSKPGACENCDPKELNEHILSRSTMLRMVLQGPLQDFGIENTELISHYVYKHQPTSTTMHTVVAAQLIFRHWRELEQMEKLAEEQQDSPQDDDGIGQSLLYDNHWDVQEKHFYELGDQSIHSSPFQAITNKVEQAQQLIGRLLLTQTTSNPIEVHQVMQLQRVVEVFRMCSVEELKQISQFQGPRSGEEEKQQQQQLIAECLAMAGTRNSLEVLSEKITRHQLTIQQAYPALKALQALPAPSDPQAELVLQLCQHSAVRRWPSLKQACWLSFGAILAQLCQGKKTPTKNSPTHQHLFTPQTGYQPIQPSCSPPQQQIYKQALMEQFIQARTTYEKVLALKAIGNAGLELTLRPLERIISGQKVEERTVRIQAIDALRRMRHQAPKQIQAILLPLFQNTNEVPELRMTAFYMLVLTQPDSALLNQLAYTLVKEGPGEVHSFLHSTIQHLANSRLPTQRYMAKHLKNGLKMVKKGEEDEQFHSSREYQLPVFTEEADEGVVLKLISVFHTNRSPVPSHVSVSVDSLFNHQYQVNRLSLSATQQHIGRWYESLIETITRSNSNSNSQQSPFSTSMKEEKEKELSQIFRDLNIQARQPQNFEPFAMMSLRIRDVDQLILPIDQHHHQSTFPLEMIQQLLRGKEWSSFPSPSSSNTQPFHLTTTLNLNEKSGRIPTSLGVPLRIHQAMPLMASIEGKFLTAGPTTNQTQFSLHSSACVAHIQRMEAWFPGMLVSGVERTAGVEVNLPIQWRLEFHPNQGLHVQLSVAPPPQTTGTRVLGLHSLPLTYTRQWDWKRAQLQQPKIQAIHYAQLQQVDVNRWVDGQHLMPLQIHGHYHSQSTTSRQPLRLLMSTENHIHVNYVGREEDSPPPQLILRLQANPFQQLTPNQLSEFRPQPKDFELNGRAEYSGRLQAWLNTSATRISYQPSRVFQHSLKMWAEMKGGGSKTSTHAHLHLNTTCDAHWRFCRWGLNVEHTGIWPPNQKKTAAAAAAAAAKDEPWRLEAKLQVLAPESVGPSSSTTPPQMLCQSHVQWGAPGRQQQAIQLAIQAHRALSPQHLEQQEEEEEEEEERHTAFLNHYNVLAVYNLRPSIQQVFGSGLELLHYRRHAYHSRWEWRDGGRDGVMHARVEIHPINQKHINLWVNSPTQSVEMMGVELPIRVHPFPLFQSPSRPIHSIQGLIKALGRGVEGTGVCQVDDTRGISSFNALEYPTQIGSCYTVLAKDCTTSHTFVVAIKTVKGRDKKIKVVSRQQTIVCQPTGIGSTKKLECRVNGQLVEPFQDLYAGVVDYMDQEKQKHLKIRVKEGVEVGMSCGCGQCECQTVQIQLSHHHQHTQCGLCGPYDDHPADPQLRMANNQLTQDFQQFQRSYSLTGQQGECTTQPQDDFHSPTTDKLEHQQLQDVDENEAPVEQTVVVEYDHEVCFSVGPVKQCRKGMKPAKDGEDDTYYDEDNQKASKEVAFVCLSRSSDEVRRLQQQAENGMVLNIPQQSPSFTEFVEQPRRCVTY